MKSNKVEITVSKKSFDTAYAAIRKGKLVTNFCLLAIAIKSAFPKKQVGVLFTTANVGKTHYDLPVKAQKLIHKFDSLPFHGNPDKREKAQIKKFRASLPVSFKMTEVVEEAAAAAA